LALASYDGSVRLRELATRTVFAELSDHPDVVYSAGFSPDGRLLVGQRLCDGGGTVNLPAAECLKRWRGSTRRRDGGGKSN
jgi:WD40 repeat protein